MHKTMHKVMHKVFVTRKIPGPGITLLKKHCQVRVYPQNRIISRQELLKGVTWCDALLCLLTDKIDRQVIDANPKLKIISNYAVGYNNIDVAYATQKKIPVTNTPGPAITDAVAEHTVALMFALSKRLVEADTFTRKGKYRGWEPELLLGTQLKGKTLGIIGLGRIGSGVAERCTCMGMNVIYYDVVRSREFEKKFKAAFLPLNRVLKQADFVTLHVPLLPSTRHLIGKKQFSLMKRTAYLINTSRGAVVDEKVLVQALRNRAIAGAALDVYEHELRLAPGLATLDNIILTPHIASATIEARSAMSKDAAENILQALQGKMPERIVNKEVFGNK